MLFWKRHIMPHIQVFNESVEERVPRFYCKTSDFAMKHYIDNSTPRIFTGYAEALETYMKESPKSLGVSDLERMTGISEKQIKRYLSKKERQVPSLKYAVAICLALNLIPDRSEEMLALAKHTLRYVSREEMAYKFLLQCCYNLSVEECNELLEREGFEALTKF